MPVIMSHNYYSFQQSGDRDVRIIEAKISHQQLKDILFKKERTSKQSKFTNVQVI